MHEALILVRVGEVRGMMYEALVSVRVGEAWDMMYEAWVRGWERAGA